MFVLVDVGRSVREAFFMFWETLWPLTLGFGLSGVVQTFVTREQMQRVMGTHRPASVARASFFGMVSSSCSYAASAMAKSMFQKGADFLSAMVFMFASTNLVVELGIVLAVLLGWQFAAAEFVGGPIMIVLLALLGGLVFTPRLVQMARQHLRASSRGKEDHAHDAGHGATPDAGHGATPDAGHSAGSSPSSGRPKFTSPAAWADAAANTVADLTMLRRELVIGYLVAGFLAVLVPTGAWDALFVHGHGAWTALENAVVGPIIAFASFVCSVGNVPLAAALWKGGISFGGVVSFVFADLLAAPLVLIYRRYYGWAVAGRLVLVFWVVMSAAGLAVGSIFSASGLVPTRRTGSIVDTSFHWNATTFLNFLFLVAFAAIYWLYRNRERLGGGVLYATDPVCGMQVRVADAPAHRRHQGTNYRFCSDRCAEEFSRDPGRSRRRPSRASR